MQNEVHPVRQRRTRSHNDITTTASSDIPPPSMANFLMRMGRVFAFIFKLYALAVIHFLIWPVNYVKLYNLVDAPASSLGPLARFLKPDCPESIRAPARVERLLIYMMLGSMLLLWATGDEYLYGGQASTAVFAEPPFMASAAAENSVKNDFSTGIHNKKNGQRKQYSNTRSADECAELLQPINHSNTSDTSHDDASDHVPELHFPMHVAFRNLGCKVDGVDKPVLRRVSGVVRPGRITGILGPSGSGKTTLAASILGRNRRICAAVIGQVYLNGSPRSLESFLDRIGFVPQQDVLHPQATVEETLLFSARWRLPISTTEQQLARIINQTLCTMNLGAVRSQRIGDEHHRVLSGGEVKRVSIAKEFIARPSVLVMDEPTTGLDSASAYQLMRTLRSVAARGVAVVTVLHHPSARMFGLLDDVVLLQDGEAAYVGPRKDLQTYFESLGFVWDPANRSIPMSSAEFVLDILAGTVSYPPNVTNSRELRALSRKAEHCAVSVLNTRNSYMGASSSSSSINNARTRLSEHLNNGDIGGGNIDMKTRTVDGLAQYPVCAWSTDHRSDGTQCRIDREDTEEDKRTNARVAKLDSCLRMLDAYQTAAHSGSSLAQIWRSHAKSKELWKKVQEEMKLMKQWETQVLQAAGLSGGNDTPKTSQSGYADEKQPHYQQQQQNQQQQDKPSVESCELEPGRWRRQLCLIRHGTFGRRSNSPFKRTKPGLERQIFLWLENDLQLTWRRGIWPSLFVTILLAVITGYVRSYNNAWSQRSFSNLMICLAISLLGTVGAIFDGDLIVVTRAIEAGMLMGTHHIAGVVMSLFKGILICHVFAAVYHLSYWIRTGMSISRTWGHYHSFVYILYLNFHAASAMGDLIREITQHHFASSHVLAVGNIIGCHVFSFYSPNRNQVDNGSILLGKYNFAPIVNLFCSMSYTRYFLELITLWEARDADRTGRSYVLRYFGYKEANQSNCVSILWGIAFWIQWIRATVFFVFHLSDFHSLNDTPLFLIYWGKIYVVQAGFMFVRLLIQEADTIKKMGAAPSRRVLAESQVQETGYLLYLSESHSPNSIGSHDGSIDGLLFSPASANNDDDAPYDSSRDLLHSGVLLSSADNVVGVSDVLMSVTGGDQGNHINETEMNETDRDEEQRIVDMQKAYEALVQSLSLPGPDGYNNDVE